MFFVTVQKWDEDHRIQAEQGKDTKTAVKFSPESENASYLLEDLKSRVTATKDKVNHCFIFILFFFFGL